MVGAVMATVSGSGKRVTAWLGAAALAGALASPAAALSVHSYGPQGSFLIPGNTFDALPDGRLIVSSGNSVFLESAARSRSFSLLGTLNTAGGSVSGFGASFISVSPDGSKVAVGDNNFGAAAKVAVFDVANPGATQWFSVPNFSAAWRNSSELFVSGGADSIYRLDLGSSSIQTVLGNIGGASGGIAFDAQGNLYTANGFDFDATPGTPETGWIKAYSAAQVDAALTTLTPLDFTSQGILVADLLSGSPLEFDNAGNLLVGGGDFFGGVNDQDFVALVQASLVQQTLLGGPIITSADLVHVHRLDPDTTSSFNFYSVVYNAATNEVLVKDFVGPVHSFAPVPEPLAASLAGMGLLGLSMTLTSRRRRGSVSAH